MSRKPWHLFGKVSTPKLCLYVIAGAILIKGIVVLVLMML